MAAAPQTSSVPAKQARGDLLTAWGWMDPTRHIAAQPQKRVGSTPARLLELYQEQKAVKLGLWGSMNYEIYELWIFLEPSLPAHKYSPPQHCSSCAAPHTAPYMFHAASRPGHPATRALMPPATRDVVHFGRFPHDLASLL